jgi:UDP-N-acetyl-2-amino-2-deoxyglucuronate dehydrogenase
MEFSEGFTDLHTVVYREILAGRGFGIEDARPSINFVHDLRKAPVVRVASVRRHPLLDAV